MGQTVRLGAFVRRGGALLGLAALLACGSPAIASAATQSRDDPSDVPAGALGKADVRSVTWDVSGPVATLTVALDASTYQECKPVCVDKRAQIGVHVLIDTDLDGLADAEVVTTRDADGVSVDAQLRRLDRTQSTAGCQDLAGAPVGAPSTLTTSLADGLERFTFSFDPATLTGSLVSFRWAVMAQSPADLSATGPWDSVPDATLADKSTANPGDRRCDPGKTGIGVSMNDGVLFPDPLLPPPPAGPTAAVTVAGGVPPAGQSATLDASGTRTAPGTTIVAYRWDMDGDGRYDSNTGTRPIAHLILGAHTQTVTMQAVDSNFATSTATIELNPGAPPPGCDGEASIGLMRIRAGCIRHEGDDLVAEPGIFDRRTPPQGIYAINLNGISLVTHDPAARVRFDMADHEIIATGDFAVFLLNGPQGDLMLFDSGPGGLSWPLPAGGGQDPGEPTQLIGLQLAESCQGYDENASALHTTCAEAPGDLPLTGEVDIGIDTDTFEATLDVNAGIDFGPVTITGRIRLRADVVLGSVILDGIGFGIEDLEVGPVQLHRLAFDYEPPGTNGHAGDVWDSTANIEVSQFLQAQGRLIINNGRFNYMRADLMFNPGILLYAGVFLNRFAAEFGLDPLRFGGGIGASFASELQINANFLFAFLADGTGAIRMDGTATLFGGDLASAYSELWTNGYATFGGRFGYGYPSGDSPVFTAFGSIDFWAEAQRDGTLRFQGDGALTVGVMGVHDAIHGFVNNEWFAGCLSRIVTGTYNFRTRVASSMLGCDLRAYTYQPTMSRPPLRPPPHARSAVLAATQTAPGGKALRVATGERALVLEVAGKGAAPTLTLTDPKGHVYRPTATPAKLSRHGAFSSMFLPEGKVVLLRVEHPLAGTWTLTPQLGSAAIANVRTAQALPPLKITAHVSGKGHNRVLTWNARGLAGRTIRFAEHGRNTGKTIIVTDKARGRAPFAAEFGSKGVRKIEAQVSSGGIPVSAKVVAHYTAPGPQRAGGRASSSSFAAARP